MSKRSNIRWRESDAEKLTKEVKRFNAKISRLEKAHPDLIDVLPSKVSKKSLKKNITTRADLNRELKSLERFSKRGAETPVESKKGIKLTTWERKEIGYKVAKINRERTVERNKVNDMEVTSRGEPLDLKRGEMGSVRMNSLKPKKFNFDKIKKGKEWELYKDTVKRQAFDSYEIERDDRYKANYIKALENTYGARAKNIVDIMNKIPSYKVVETYYGEQEAELNFVYDKLDEMVKLDILGNIWQKSLDEVHR